MICYILSFALDGVDGFVARLLGQTSRLGVMLDMCTDRLATAALLMILASVYPLQRGSFVALLALDIASHWMHMYRSAGHHKQVGTRVNPILRAYYSCKPLFIYSCVAAEAMYVLLFALGSIGYEPQLRGRLGTAIAICIPGFFYKQVANVAQLTSSMSALAVRDEPAGVGAAAS
ncbi:unnamed protein product [Phaeothamnion confervicola]